MDMDISQSQNLQSNIDCLKAQREFYRDAKKWRTFKYLLSAPALILLSVTILFSSKYGSNHIRTDLSWIIPMATLIIMVLDQTIFNPSILKNKNKAARIQEAFDCKVLDIEWNKLIAMDKPSTETIRLSSQKRTRRLPSENVNDWYPAEKIAILPKPVQQFLCQRANVVWDDHLRNSLSVVILVILVVITIIGIIVISCVDAKLREVLNYFVSPILPLVTQLINARSKIKTDIDNLKHIRTEIEMIWKKLTDQQIQTDLYDPRSIQDAIFLFRSHNYDIPDWFYKMHKNANEDAMKYSTQALVEEYKQAHSISN